MQLDGIGLFVNNMQIMAEFYRDILGFELEWKPGDKNVYLIKDDTLFMLYGRNDFENMTSRKYQYIEGLNGHFEIALRASSLSFVK